MDIRVWGTLEELFEAFHKIKFIYPSQRVIKDNFEMIS
jgi:hypothetical protein